MVSHSTTLIEHPELAAERIGRFARMVGRAPSGGHGLKTGGLVS